MFDLSYPRSVVTLVFRFGIKKRTFDAHQNRKKNCSVVGVTFIIVCVCVWEVGWGRRWVRQQELL